VPREPSLPPRYYENVREEHASTAGKAARSKRTIRRVVAPPPGLASRCCLLPGRWSWPLRFTPYLLCSCESFDPPMDKSSVSCYIYSIEKAYIYYVIRRKLEACKRQFIVIGEIQYYDRTRRARDHAIPHALGS
jgi:hypothetical protein